MQQRRYIEIKSVFHICHPSTNTTKEDWHMKLSPLFEHLRAAFKRYIRPPQNVSIYEMIAGFKGRCQHTLKYKHKPIPKGYKNWALCFAGYTYDFLFYSRTYKTLELVKKNGLTSTGNISKFPSSSSSVFV